MKTALLVLVLVATFNAQAWGPIGQTVTVKLAETFLTKTASQKLRAITGNRSLSEFATWADGARNTPEWSQSSTWHYVNVDKRSTAENPQDILQAIDYAERELMSASTNERKLVWVKFIIHLVGDLHQPLHTGKSSDRGGNSVNVNFQGRNTNLHALWDGAMIQTLNLNTEQYSQRLIGMKLSQELLNQRFDPQDVLAENAEILEFVYSYSGNSIDQSYARKGIEKTDKRIWVGALRLASLLNQLFP